VGVKRSLFFWSEIYPLSFSDKPAESGAWINVSWELLRVDKASFLEFSLDHIGVIGA
jgi:hypothetical protein